MWLTMNFVKIGVFTILLSMLQCLNMSVFAETALNLQHQYREKQDVLQQGKDCINCHSSDLQIHKTIKDIDKCDQCHSFSNSFSNSIATNIVNNSSMSLQKVSQLKAQQDAGQVAPDHLFPQNNNALSQKDFEKINLGMRFPMYYVISRLGDNPNEMVLIPAGEFIMGTNDRLPDEGPQHKVTLPEYLIDKHEVTNLQYKKFIDATQRRSPTYFRNRTFPEGRADHPVTNVGWDDANEYCQWAGKRLATEQEWEKASRGSDARIYPWGDEFEVTHANTPGRWKELATFGDTTPVGSFAKGASPYGIHDMSGNVWEWTASWYKAHPGNKTPSESYGERYKILKGGSWWDCSFYKCGISAPVYNRSFFAKKVKNDTFGFRCAKDVEFKGSKK